MDRVVRVHRNNQVRRICRVAPAQVDEFVQSQLVGYNPASQVDISIVDRQGIELYSYTVTRS